MAVQPRTIRLSSGYDMPIVGLGTCHEDDEASVRTSVVAALDAGYRLIDTAYLYYNERHIGKVLAEVFKEGKVKRDDLFIVTKLPGNGMRPDAVERFLRKSLAALQLDYVDLYLIHSPLATEPSDNDDECVVIRDGDAKVEHVDLMDTYRALETMVDIGLVRSLGISNFNSKQIRYVHGAARIKPANLQVECQPYLPQNELLELCQQLGITMTAYAPIGSPHFRQFLKDNMGIELEVPRLLDDEKVKGIAEKHKKTPAQVLLKYQVQRGIAVIPKSQTPQRIKENIDIFDFSLDDDDFKVLQSMKCGTRYFRFDYFKGWRNHPEYPFNIPF